MAAAESITTRIFVAGSDTLLGEAIARRARHDGSFAVMDERAAGIALNDSRLIAHFFSDWKPELVVHAAGPSGGIGHNQRYPAELAHDNLAVTLPILEAAQRAAVRRLVYLASSCCYPRECTQPMRVEDLWSGPLEPTNQAYAVAKLAGIALCQAYRDQHGSDFIAAIPANAFGNADHFDAEQGHVVPALIVRMHQAKAENQSALTIWGTGQARREFLHADDVADAVVWVLRARTCPSIINLGGGVEVTIAELARTIAEVVDFRGELIFDAARPDGMPRKVLDARPLAALGWQPRLSLRAALERTYNTYREQLHPAEPVDVG